MNDPTQLSEDVFTGYPQFIEKDVWFTIISFKLLSFQIWTIHPYMVKINYFLLWVLFKYDLRICAEETYKKLRKSTKMEKRRNIPRCLKWRCFELNEPLYNQANTSKNWHLKAAITYCSFFCSSFNLLNSEPEEKTFLTP